MLELEASEDLDRVRGVKVGGDALFTLNVVSS